MRMHRRILSIFICLCMMLGLGSYVSAADLDNEYIRDYEIGLLEKLGLISKDDVSDLSQSVSRGEAIKYIISTIGYREVAEAYVDKSPFFDVENDDEYYGYVSLAAKLGICSGYTDGFFGTYDKASAEAAEKFLICGMGFPAGAANSAEGTTNFSTLARRIGIYDGISVGGELTRGKFFKMLYNALHCETFTEPFMANSGYITSGETLLHQVYGINRGTGTVTETELYSFFGRATDEGCISIDESTYVTEEDYNSLIGQNVCFYYKDEMSGKERSIIYVHPTYNTNEVYTYMSADLKAYRKDARTLECQEDGKNKSIYRRLSVDVVLLVNGSPAKELSEEYLIPKDGKVTLIDNDKDGAIDCVIAESYETYIVSAIDTDRTYVYDSISGGRIDLSDSKKRICVFDSYNREVGINSLVVGDILLAAEGEERTVIYISKNILSAVLSKHILDNGQDIYEVQGKEYKLSPYYEKNRTDKPEIGKDYLIYFDVLDRIVYVEPNTAKMNNVAFLIGGTEESGGFGNKIMLKLLLADGTLKTAKLSEKCKIDGKRCNDSDEAKKALSIKKYDKDGIEIYNGYRNTLLTYSESVDGELTEINTAYKMDTDGVLKKPYEITNGVITSSDPETKENGMYLSYEDSATREYLGIRSFSGYGVLSSSAKIFLVPVDESGNVNARTENKNYIVTGISYLTNYSKYNQEQYKYSKDSGSGDVMVIYYNPNGSKAKPDSQVTLITGIGDTIDDDGEQVKMLTGLNNGKEVSYRIERDLDMGDISVGDAVRLYFNTRDDISYVELIYDLSKDVFYGARTSYGVAYGTSFNPLYDMTDNVITLADSAAAIADVKNGEGLEKYILEGAINIYRYDENREKAEVITSAELVSYTFDPQRYDKLITLTRGARLQTIIAY